MKSNKDYVRVNYQIRCPKVRLVKENTPMGIVSIDDAHQEAKKAGLDLVEIAPHANPPVCHIMDFKKYKYKRDQKKKEQTKKQKNTEMKELRLSPRIEDHDVETKVNTIKKFLLKGQRVKINLYYKNRELSHKDRGFEIIRKFIESLEEIAKVGKAPKLEAHNKLTCILEPK